jgi:primosomal protein N' (replication factor Y)
MSGPYIVQVSVPLPVHGGYSYASSIELPIGAPVVVPFGSRKVNGWVTGSGPEDAELIKLKAVDRVLSEEPDFIEEQLRFFEWIADYYLAPLGEVIATAVPAVTSARTRHVYLPTEAGIEALAARAAEGPAGTVLREIISRPKSARSAIQRRLHAEIEDVPGVIQVLVQREWIEGEDIIVEASKDEEVWIKLAEGAKLESIPARAGKARQVFVELQAGPKRLAELEPDAVKRLEKTALVERELRARTNDWAAGPISSPPVLNAEQEAAVAGVKGIGVYLLHGVTGAGKTEVYLELTRRTLETNKQVLVLVPEIALTPQLTRRFTSRFGSSVAVLHSGLTGAERRREWRRIRAGEANVAIGARSAIFAPFHQLGLIVVDEEHDDSIKQEDGVRYNGRDLAVVRGKQAGCPVVLGSATPSLESWENARKNRYTLLTLKNRATARAVPTVQVVDLKKEERLSDGSLPLIAAPVKAAIEDALQAGGKAILLYNRRGYATFVECTGCGQAYECPSCGIALVLHQSAGRLDCHYCGFRRQFQSDCPKCGTQLSILGRGTERVEELVAETFPGVPTGRMDADTTSERGAHARILDAFREGKFRLLVGTQIVAKGHDFPDVHVAAVLGVDHILGMPDFRSAERTFSLVTQLCGRAGRGEVAGRVFLQTAHPEHPVFSCLGDMDAFSRYEEHFRRVLGYPPFTRLVLLRVEGEDRPATLQAVDALARQTRQQAKSFSGVTVLGPAPAMLPRLVGRWRYQVVLRGANLVPFREFLKAHYASWKVPKGIRVIIDVDPRGLG